MRDTRDWAGSTPRARGPWGGGGACPPGVSAALGLVPGGSLTEEGGGRQVAVPALGWA